MNSLNKKKLFIGFCAITAVLIQLLFFLLIKPPTASKTYICFAFLLLSYVISGCVAYITPRKPEQLFAGTLFLLCVYLAAALLFNLLIASWVGLTAVILTNWLLIVFSQTAVLALKIWWKK